MLHDLFITHCKREITLPLGMNQVCSSKFSILVWIIHSISFLFMTLWATGSGILVKRVLTLKDTKVTSGVTFGISEIWLILCCL